MGWVVVAVGRTGRKFLFCLFVGKGQEVCRRKCQTQGEGEPYKEGMFAFVWESPIIQVRRRYKEKGGGVFTKSVGKGNISLWEVM